MLPTFLVRVIRQLPAFGVGGVMNTTLVHRGRDHNLHEYFSKPRAATEPDDAGPWPAPKPEHRRRIADSYSPHLDILDLLGSEVDPAAVESASGWLRRAGSRGLPVEQIEKAAGLRRFKSAQAGYYPELSELVEKKLRDLENDMDPLVGLLGDSHDIPDVDSDLSAQLQQLNCPPELANPGVQNARPKNR
eukprot:3512121-Prymnesium_polylepis.1